MKKSRNPNPKTAAVPPLKRETLLQIGLLAAVLVLTFATYSNSLHAPFLMDNDEIILKDPRVHAVTPVQLHRILSQQYWETATTGLYRPLTTLSYLFNYAILGNGEDPYGYHWFNLILHSMNIVFVYALALALFEAVGPAILLSALWGLHPVLTEAVTNVVGRADLLAAFGVLAALLCHRQALRASGARKVAWLLGILLAVTVGVFSKESAIVVVAVLIVHDFALQRSVSWRVRGTGYIAAAIPCLLYLYVRSQVLANAPYLASSFTDNPLLGADFWTARITAAGVIFKYLGLLLWPARLSCDYSYNQIPLFSGGLNNWEDWKDFLSVTGCLAAVVFAALSVRKHKAAFFGIALFFVALAPASNVAVVIGTTMGERLLYLPAIGFAIAFVWALHLLWQRVPATQPTYRQAGYAAWGIVLIALMVRTSARNLDWGDQRRFWQSAVAAAPASYKTHLGVANSTVILTQEDWDRAVNNAAQALAILDSLPDSENEPAAYRDVAFLYRSLGDRSRDAAAASWYRKALAALLRSERIELVADQRYREENAKRGRPGLTSLPSKLYLELGRVYMRLNDVPHALAAFDRGRKLESSPDLLEETAAAYQTAGDPRNAVRAFVEAMAMDAARTQLNSKVIGLYQEIDPKGCAVGHEANSVFLNVECPLVHADICTASRNVARNYLQRGQAFEASEIRRRAEKDLGCAPELLR